MSQPLGCSLTFDNGTALLVPRKSGATEKRLFCYINGGFLQAFAFCRTLKFAFGGWEPRTRNPIQPDILRMVPRREVKQSAGGALLPPLAQALEPSSQGPSSRKSGIFGGWYWRVWGFGVWGVQLIVRLLLSSDGSLMPCCIPPSSTPQKIGRCNLGCLPMGAVVPCFGQFPLGYPFRFGLDGSLVSCGSGVDTASLRSFFFASFKAHPQSCQMRIRRFSVAVMSHFRWRTVVTSGSTAC